PAETSQPMQPLQSPTSGPVSPRLTLRQVPPPPQTPALSPSLRQLQEQQLRELLEWRQQYLEDLVVNGQINYGTSGNGQMTLPSQPPQGGGIRMSPPAPQGVRLGTRP
ncbi:MAG: hypothetical protein SNJ67_10990, partial [Chloracidobacterium sp.]